MPLFQLAANFVSALSFDFVNGFHDAPNVTAAPVATKTLNRRQAVAWNTLWTLTPLFIVSTSVAKTVGTGLLATPSLTPPVITVGLAAAVIWGLMTWRKGIPSSSTYALFGGLLGAAGFNSMLDHGWSLSLFFAPVIASGWLSVLGAMVAAPIIGFGLAHCAAWFATSQTMKWLHDALEQFIHPHLTLREIIKDSDLMKFLNRVCVETFEAADKPLAWIEQNIGPFLLFGEDQRKKRDTTSKRSPFKGTSQQYAQLVSSGYLSWAHAHNDAMKTAGIITVALHAAGLGGLDVVPWVLALSFITMAIGTALGGARIEKTLVEKLGDTTPNRGILAQIVAGGIVEAASMHGIPLSTTLALTGATTGSNKTNKDGWKMAYAICVRWGLTMPATAAIAAALMALCAGTHFIL